MKEMHRDMLQQWCINNSNYMKNCSNRPDIKIRYFGLSWSDIKWPSYQPGGRLRTLLVSPWCPAKYLTETIMRLFTNHVRLHKCIIILFGGEVFLINNCSIIQWNNTACVVITFFPHPFISSFAPCIENEFAWKSHRIWYYIQRIFFR